MAAASDYVNRNRVEVAIGRYEKVIGGDLRFRNDERRATEVAIAVQVLDRMLELERPISRPHRTN